MTEQFIKLLEVFGIRKKLRKITDTSTNIVVDGGVVSTDSQLAAIDQSVFAATIVDAFIYDTEKDSDGGAWRHRCGHTSWENETLSGNWLGSAANEAAARAISGATTGSYYYDTTAAGFYTLNAGSGKTATYRGNVRQFPAKVLITVEAARVVLWDLTQANAPMWMVFAAGSTYLLEATTTSAAMLNGKLVLGKTTTGITVVDYLMDIGYVHISATTRYYRRSIVGRNTAVSIQEAGVLGALISNAVNDVAMTVLPGAPVDVATGLPIPVIDVFTDAGTSRINTDGTVADLVDTAGDDHKAGCILASGDSVALNSTNGNVDIYKLSNTLADTLTPDRTYDQATTPALLEAVDAGDKVVAMRYRLAIGQDNGVNVLIENPASVAAGMIAYITKDYTSGWLPGNIRGAWLADSVAETITGSGELVVNGTFDTDTSGWTSVNGPTVSVTAGKATIQNAGATYGLIYRAITTVVGKTYLVSADVVHGGTGVARIEIQTSAPTSVGGGGINATASGGHLNGAFVALGTTSYIVIGNRNDNNASHTYDNISVKLADPDRSVKAKGLQINGSLTKAAVASGAQLVGYSGFSAANFLEQPYNSDLDFGTAAFAFPLALKEAANSADEVIFERAYYTGGAYSGARIRAEILAAGTLKCTFSDGTNSATITTSAALDDATWKAGIMVGYDGTNFRITQAGVNLATPVARGSVGSLTNANAVLRVCLGVDGNSPLTNGTLALLRTTATWPTDEQAKHIFETEKPLFEANANCLLAGSSNAVTALAYDDATDLLHVGTSYGRSQFKGLVRTASEATAIGAITALSAQGGFIAQGGASGADIYVPAYLLREELAHGEEHSAQGIEFQYFTATAAQTNYVLPAGWVPVAVYSQGLLVTEAAGAGNWAKSFDGFLWSAVLGTGSTAGNKIGIMAKRT